MSRSYYDGTCPHPTQPIVVDSGVLLHNIIRFPLLVGTVIIPTGLV